MNPTISIITLNWNRKDDLQRTLSTIQSQTYEPKEIIVVDNGSTDGSADAISQNFPDIKLIRLNQNTGVAGYNRGIEAAEGNIVLLIDNDMDLLQPDTLEKVEEYFQKNPSLGAAALQVREPVRKTLSPNNPKYSAANGDDQSGYRCSTFDGGAVAFNREVLKKTGLYIPEFFVYHSEVELSTRIWDYGFEIRYFPEVAVSHRESNVARDRDLQTFYSTRNYLWYTWIYFPLGSLIVETLHFLQMSFIQNLRKGRSLKAWARGVGMAVMQWPKVGWYRKPVQKKTLRMMQAIRDEDRRRKLNA